MSVAILVGLALFFSWASAHLVQIFSILLLGTNIYPARGYVYWTSFAILFVIALWRFQSRLGL